MLAALAGAAPATPAAELSVSIKGPKGDPLADVVISLVPVDGAPVPAPDVPAEVAQEGQEFVPYVTVVQAGSRVVFPNNDTVQHHVYSLSKAKKFELPLYNPHQKESFVFDMSGLVTIGCNIHDWMLAYLVVVPTPYFAKTDVAGVANVTAPAGRYRLDVWHPRLAASVSQEISFTTESAEKRDFTLTLKPDRRIRRSGPTKTGGYR
jgi:plastocyanin